MTNYLLANESIHAQSRFFFLEQLFDPITREALRTVPLHRRARVWEVGAGGGSIAALLEQRTRPVGGHVLATDVNMKWMRPITGVTTLVHDLETDDYPSIPFNLIHARLVVQHLVDPWLVLRQLVAALAPGGSLVVEELDPLLPYHPNPTTDDHALINLVGDGFTRLLEDHAHPALGRSLHRELSNAGLVDVTNHGHLIPSSGGGPGARLMQANVLQMRRRLVDLGISHADLDRYYELMNDPDTDFMLPVFFTAKGVKPS